MTSSEALQILLVEDDDDHAEVVVRAFQASRVANRIDRVADGEAALDYVFRRDTYSDVTRSPTPGVILLDLRLPRLDGLDVLRIIKESASTRHIPVVVLTTSDAERDLEMAYQNSANSYLVKPVNFKDFAEMMKTLGLYWLTWNRSPFGKSH